MLKKLFKTKYVPYDAKYIQLSAEDERNIRTITDDIKTKVRAENSRCFGG